VGGFDWEASKEFLHEIARFGFMKVYGPDWNLVKGFKVPVISAY